MSNTTIEIRRENNHLIVHSPYSPDFPDRAKKIGGRWDDGKRYWKFDTRDETRVRDLCREIYGTDGADQPTLVTLRVRKAAFGQPGWRKASWFLAGRLVARVFGRDSGASLGDGVIVIEGDVTSGGSKKNPGLQATDDLVIEIRDVPEPAARKVIAEKPPGSVEIVDCKEGT
jgi:hypothetical protein